MNLSVLTPTVKLGVGDCTKSHHTIVLFFFLFYRRIIIITSLTFIMNWLKKIFEELNILNFSQSIYVVFFSVLLQIMNYPSYICNCLFIYLSFARKFPKICENNYVWKNFISFHFVIHEDEGLQSENDLELFFIYFDTFISLKGTHLSIVLSLTANESLKLFRWIDNDMIYPCWDTGWIQ